MGDMCGRFAVTTDPAVLAEKIHAINEARAGESAGPNYNVAPTTTITTVVRRHEEPDDEPTQASPVDALGADSAVGEGRS